MRIPVSYNIAPPPCAYNISMRIAGLRPFLVLIYADLLLVSTVDICKHYPKPDPCLPGGEWDPVLNR